MNAYGCRWMWWQSCLFAGQAEYASNEPAVYGCMSRTFKLSAYKPSCALS
ncbi:hypothetical protein [Allobaculum sp. Allo2]|nr:hypothetical protein [Allobaculum sp. Allo2]UNT93746.1 hypothetical protein KWG61_03140 [Allobaculum sp. Allo2]